MKKSPKKTTKKRMTIEDLALMVARGFENTATKDDINEIWTKLGEIDEKLFSVDGRLDDIDTRLGKIENNHGRRIDILEDRMRIIVTALEKSHKLKI